MTTTGGVVAALPRDKAVHGRAGPTSFERGPVCGRSSIRTFPATSPTPPDGWLDRASRPAAGISDSTCVQGGLQRLYGDGLHRLPHNIGPPQTPKTLSPSPSNGDWRILRVVAVRVVVQVTWRYGLLGFRLMPVSRGARYESANSIIRDPTSVRHPHLAPLDPRLHAGRLRNLGGLRPQSHVVPDAQC